MAVTDALAVSPSVFGAGLAADDLILTLYFTTIYTLAKSIPPDPPSAATAGRMETGGGSETDAAAAEVGSSSGTSDGGAGTLGRTSRQEGTASQTDAILLAAPSSAATSDQAGQAGHVGGHGGGIEMKPIHVSVLGDK